MKTKSRPAKRSRNILLKRDQLLPFKGSLDYLASRLPGGRAAFMELVALAAEIEPSLAPVVLTWRDLAVHLTHVAPTACGLGVGGLSSTDTSLAKGTGAVLTACSRRR
jgi:hypothetical protein